MLSSRYDVFTVCDTSDTRCCMLDYGVTVISVTESDVKHYYIQDYQYNNTVFDICALVHFVESVT